MLTQNLRWDVVHQRKQFDTCVGTCNSQAGVLLLQVVIEHLRGALTVILPKACRIGMLALSNLLQTRGELLIGEHKLKEAGPKAFAVVELVETGGELLVSGHELVK